MEALRRTDDAGAEGEIRIADDAVAETREHGRGAVGPGVESVRDHCHAGGEDSCRLDQGTDLLQQAPVREFVREVPEYPIANYRIDGSGAGFHADQRDQFPPVPVDDALALPLLGAEPPGVHVDRVVVDVDADHAREIVGSHRPELWSHAQDDTGTMAADRQSVLVRGNFRRIRAARLMAHARARIRYAGLHGRSVPVQSSPRGRMLRSW